MQCCDVFGASNEESRIHLYDVECHGSESNIANCTFSENTVDLTHESDVGVKCKQGQFHKD